MQDRIPLYPGRVKMTPVAGQANTFDMVRADDPTQAGTPLNKATLLKDATAELYGLGTGAVPDDVYVKIFKDSLRKKRLIVFDESTTWTAPNNIADNKIKIIASGGGGAGGYDNSKYGSGGGGGSGFIAVQEVDIIPGTQYTIAIGAAGEKSTANSDGGRGGTTTFSNGPSVLVSAGGGYGGQNAGRGGKGNAPGGVWGNNNGIDAGEYGGGSGASNTTRNTKQYKGGAGGKYGGGGGGAVVADYSGSYPTTDYGGAGGEFGGKGGNQDGSGEPGSIFTEDILQFYPLKIGNETLDFSGGSGTQYANSGNTWKYAGGGGGGGFGGKGGNGYASSGSSAGGSGGGFGSKGGNGGTKSSGGGGGFFGNGQSSVYANDTDQPGGGGGLFADGDTGIGGCGGKGRNSGSGTMYGHSNPGPGRLIIIYQEVS